MALIGLSSLWRAGIRGSSSSCTSSRRAPVWLRAGPLAGSCGSRRDRRRDGV